MIPTPDALAATKSTLASGLQGEGFAAESIALDASPGPAGSTIVRASAAGAYPGTGVRSALVAGGHTYGPRGGLASFARAQGWLDAPPDAQSLVQAANVLCFDGLLALDADPPVVSAINGGLRLTLVRRTFPSGARERVTIDVPPTGAERVATGDADAPDRAPTPIDKVAALLIALDANDVPAIAAAIGNLPAASTAREFAALSRAALHPNDTIAADALMKLGGSDEAAGALAAALAASTGAQREAVTSMAGEIYGADFTARLR